MTDTLSEQIKAIPDAPAEAGIGHNLLSREERIRADVLDRHKHLLPRTQELLAEVEKIPNPIPEEIAGGVTDFIKSLTAQRKAIEGARVAEKEEFLSGSRIVDGIFKTMLEPLEVAKTKIEARLGVVLRAREERRRKEAEEKARIEREAAAERKRIADETAARERAEAEEARRLAAAAEAKLAEERAQRQREAAERERKAGEARQEREREAAAERQREADRLAEIERERAAAAERTRLATEAAAEAGRKRDAEVRAAKAAEEKLKREEAEAERRAEERRKEDDRLAKVAAQRVEDDRKAQERRDREAEREAERERERVARAAKDAERTAGRAERDADKAATQEQAAEAKERRAENSTAADNARLRGEYGGLSTLQEFFTFANLERETLDLETLRAHIAEDALEGAVRSFIAAGGRELRGVDIFRDTKTIVR